MKKLLIPFILISMLIVSITVYSRDLQNDLSHSLIRLHILADSDSLYDQSIKLSVRDEVLAAVKNVSINDTNAFTQTAEAAANTYLKSHSIPYRAKAEYGLFDFPEKNYMNIALPAGKYYGVRIILGSGSGHNWWCVMYPPLCVSGNDAYADEEAKKELLKMLRSDSYDAISDKTQKREVKFKLIELLSKK